MEMCIRKFLEEIFVEDGNYNLLNYVLTLLDVNARDKIGNTILHYASRTRDIKKLLMVTKVVDLQDRTIINLRNNCGQHALHVAVEYSTIEVVEYFLKWSKVNVNVWNPFYGSTALHLAIGNKKYDIVKFFVYKCPEIDLSKCDKYGNTARMAASKLNDRRMIKIFEDYPLCTL